MRASGILMPIFSLPEKYGIGTLGKEAYKFIDFLKNSGQSYWQILPLGPTSYGDSPYQSFSTFAGNPYFIDFDILKDEKLLKESDYININWGDNKEEVDYGKLYNNKFNVLKIAFENFDKSDKNFVKFCKENESWLNSYSTYMALKDYHNGKSWLDWDTKFKLRTYSNEDILFLKNDIEFWKVIQFLFYKQLGSLKKYANDNKIKIIGDLPIYVALDSADVWTNPKIFALNKNLLPTSVAGYPSYSDEDDGQLWGNPLYLWTEEKENVYKWWFKRLEHQKSLYNVLRLDHFIGFERYCSIPYGDENGKRGKWVQGPGIDFFKEVKKNVKNLDIIAEDLGELTDGVIKMLEFTGYPGMKIMEYNLDHEDKNNKPHNYINNCVAYIGTHDNETALGWLKSIDKEQLEFAKDYLRLDNSDLVFSMIKSLLATNANTVIIQMQDLLELDNTAQINKPGTFGCNWKWRMKENSINENLESKILKYTKIYSRI